MMAAESWVIIDVSYITAGLHSLKLPTIIWISFSPIFQVIKRIDME